VYVYNQIAFNIITMHVFITWTSPDPFIQQLSWLVFVMNVLALVPLLAIARVY